MKNSKGKLLFLFSMLILEVALIFLLKKFGLLGIGTGIQFVVSLLFVLLPLVIAGAVLLRNRLRFSLWAMMIGTAMIAIFLSLSMIPLFRYRTARQGSAKLLVAKGHVVEGLKNFRWYETYKLDPLPEKQPAPPDTLPLWLASFSSGMKDVPRDADVSQIVFMNDEQCKIFAENWKRFTNLRMLGINRGVSSEGFKLLQDIIPKLESLDVVLYPGRECSKKLVSVFDQYSDLNVT